MTLDERIKERATQHGKNAAWAAIGKEYAAIYAVVPNRRLKIGDRHIHLDDVFEALNKELAESLAQKEYDRLVTKLLDSTDEVIA